jgi:hypothetical protein
MELFGLYWHIWSKLMILSSEKLIEVQKFGKSSIEIMGQYISVDYEHAMVIQRGMHWSKFRITAGPTFVQIFCLVIFEEPTSVPIKDCRLGRADTGELRRGHSEDVEVMSHNMLTSGPHLFPECFHSRSIHKDHKLSPIGNPLGKFGIDARCRQMKIQAEKDRVGRGYHLIKIFFFFFRKWRTPKDISLFQRAIRTWE